jgi:hypothetical protein
MPLNANINGLLKKNQITGLWDNIATSVTTVGNRTRVTFNLTDGGPYDADRAIDGRITDPAFPAVTTPSEVKGSSGGSPGAWLLAPFGLLALRRRFFLQMAVVSLPVLMLLSGTLHAAETVHAKQSMNLRAKPSLASPVVAVADPTKPLTLLGVDGEFAHLRTADGREGYFKRKYLKETVSTAAASTPQMAVAIPAQTEAPVMAPSPPVKPEAPLAPVKTPAVVTPPSAVAPPAPPAA